MRVRLMHSDEDGCGFYRMQEPARVGALAGVEVELSEEIPTEAMVTERAQYMRVRQDRDAYPFDMIVLQRPMKRELLWLIPEFQRLGIAVAVELDDDPSCLHPMHPGRDAFEGRADPGMHWHNIRDCCKLADLVIVTTQVLADRYAPHGRSVILPNCIPEWVLGLERKSDGHTIGYTGAIHYHRGDLEATHGGVQGALAVNPDWRFLKIGGGAELVQKGLGLRDRPGQTGPLPLAAFHERVPELDVGIAPLAPSRFNRAKSYLKLLEYSACGIPFVASDLDDYLLFHEETGLGLIVPERGRNWRAACRKLMEDEGFRREEGERAREIARGYTYEANAGRWIDAWELAVQNHRQRSAVLA